MRALLQVKRVSAVGVLLFKPKSEESALVGKVRSLDLGRVLQITISLLALVAIFVQGGRILERTESTKVEIVDLINHNEQKRDLKDSIKAQELEQLKHMIEAEIADRKDSDKRLERMRDLMMVKFGQAIPLDKEK